MRHDSKGQPQLAAGDTLAAERVRSRLAAYVATGGGLLGGLAAEGQAAIVARTTPVSFGINEEVNIDFNSDGQIDFQIDHDRVNLNGTDLDFLQIDKNDVSSAENPLAVDVFATFPTNGTNANGDAQILTFTNDFGDSGGYPVALKQGDLIGANSSGSLVAGTKWDFQEGDNFLGLGTSIRANRLLDEDAGQIDQTLGGAQVTVPLGPQPEFPDLDDFTGLGGETRYLGVRVDLNDAASPGLNDGGSADFPNQFWYGWIGVRIDNEADATGVVTGWAYESEPGAAIAAGDTGPGIPGDFDGNGTVDGADLLLWQREAGGLLTYQDVETWEGSFAAGVAAQVGQASATSVAVPEPSSWLAAVVGIALFAVVFARRRLHTRAKFSRYTGQG